MGGSVPLYDEIVLTTTNMNRIISFNEVTPASSLIGLPPSPLHRIMCVARPSSASLSRARVDLQGFLMCAGEWDTGV